MNLSKLLLVASSPWAALVYGHDLGIHGLSGECPMGDPMPNVPEIAGSFRVEVQVRPIDITHPYHAIFHWTDNQATPNSILFGYGTSGFRLWIEDAATSASYDCIITSSVLVLEQLHRVKVTVDASGYRVTVDNTVAGNCAPSTIVLPSNIARQHYLGESSYTATDPDIEDFVGTIVGIMVVSDNNPSEHPRDKFKFWNIGSQILQSTGFVASWYSRYDNILDDRKFQRVFDFSNGHRSDNIECSQIQNREDIRCRVWVTDPVDGPIIVTAVTATGVLLENEWAFWHFHVMNNGTGLLEKDGVEVARIETGAGVPTGLFRSMNRFGQSTSTDPLHFILDGAVLGFRLDTEVTT